MMVIAYLLLRWAIEIPQKKNIFQMSLHSLHRENYENHHLLYGYVPTNVNYVIVDL